MASSKHFVVLQVILISIIFLAFQVAAARELVETSSAPNLYHKMERKLNFPGCQDYPLCWNPPKHG